MVRQAQKKPRPLSRLQKLSLASKRRMGLEDEIDTVAATALADLLKSLRASIERKVDKKIEEAIAKLEKQRPSGISALLSVSTGVRSLPPVGSKKIKNLYVTPEGRFHVEFDG